MSVSVMNGRTGILNKPLVLLSIGGIHCLFMMLSYFVLFELNNTTYFIIVNNISLPNKINCVIYCVSKIFINKR